MYKQALKGSPMMVRDFYNRVMDEALHLTDKMDSIIQPIQDAPREVQQDAADKILALIHKFKDDADARYKELQDG